MKINNLTLTNFKGIAHIEVAFDGKNTVVYGNNGTGKTTIYDAFLWLLFGKDSQSSSKFSAKPINAPNGTEVSVTGVFEIDGKTVELKKTLKENWTKKRGAMEETYAGDITYCYVNEVPYKVTEYSEYIKGICDEEVFKLLTNPLHFNTNIKWQDRRRTLFEICGNVTDEMLFVEVLEEYGQAEQGLKSALALLQENATDEEAMSKLKIAQNKLSTLKGYKVLYEAMGERSFEEFKKILAERRKSINKEIELIPTKINEASLSIVEVDVKLADEKLIELKPRQQDLETQLNKVQTGATIATLNTQLSDFKTQLQDLERKNQQYQNSQEDAQRETINSKAKESEEQLAKVSSELSLTTSLFQNTVSQVDTQKQLTDRYRNEYMKLMEEQQTLETVCPTCRQAIPQEQIETAKKTYEENRIANLTLCKELGTKAKLQALEFEKQAKDLSTKGLALTTQSKLLKEQIERIRSEPRTYKDLPKYATDKGTLQAQIQATESELSNAKVNLTQELERLKTTLQTVRNEVEKYEKDKLQHEQNKSAKQRISDYEVQQKGYIKQFEETEKQLYYCDLFTKKKVDLITEQVNSKFKIANFKLFNTLVNGGIEDCCEVVVEGVPFSDLNNAMRINVGIDVINTLQEHFSFAPPVFVDNIESVTNVYKLNSQLIELVVPTKFERLPKIYQQQLIDKYVNDKETLDNAVAKAKAAYYAPYNILRIETEDN